MYIVQFNGTKFAPVYAEYLPTQLVVLYPTEELALKAAEILNDDERNLAMFSTWREEAGSFEEENEEPNLSIEPDPITLDRLKFGLL